MQTVHRTEPSHRTQDRGSQDGVLASLAALGCGLLNTVSQMWLEALRRYERSIQLEPTLLIRVECSGCHEQIRLTKPLAPMPMAFPLVCPYCETCLRVDIDHQLADEQL